MRAQAYRHSITVQRKTATVDPATGYDTTVWVDRLVGLPAWWLPGPGREYLAGDATRAATTGRLGIRWSVAADAIQAGDRVLWDGRIMEIVAPPLVDATARRELTLMVTEAGTDGT